MKFPQDFLWGVATASYQIEGAELEDGRGECIWTRYSRTPGMVLNGDTGAVACDHYHRYPEDIALMKQLGLDAYRFSISWPRILPDGVGRINEAGLDFYSRIIDELLEQGIQPWATLYHWDLPQALQDKGGWANADIVNWFADYTDIVLKAFGDRVPGWITLNEPWCSAFLGYLIGRHAPGVQNPVQAFRAAHHLLLSHGAAMPIMRHHAPNAQHGITLNLCPQQPGTDKPEDIEAAALAEEQANAWFMDPVFKGTYPEKLVKHLGPILDGLDLDEIKRAAVPMDFLGVNYYMRWMVVADPEAPSGWRSYSHEGEWTDMGWEIYPDGMRDELIRVTKEYGPEKIYITENGAAFPDPETVEGDVLEDPMRVDFYKGYLGGAAQAIEAGVPLKGYFAWSFMDNFEWGWGYTKRFGLVHVDYQTQRRTLKRSALYYQSLLQTGQV